MLVEFEKDFVVAIRSLNTNSFGLRQHILIARDGEAHSLCVSCCYDQQFPAGTVVPATISLSETGSRSVRFTTMSGELQQELPECPPQPTQEFWELVDAQTPCDPYSSRQAA